MFLVFEPSNLPYAEVLSYLLANANKKINVGLAPLDAVNPFVFHILPTEKDRSKKILIGKCSVSRYFARIASKPLYSSLSLSNQIVVDDVLDNVRNRHISEVLKVINAAEGNYILGSKISLADIIAYDYFKVNPQPKTSETFTNWFNKIDNLPEAVEAAKIIKNALNTSDVNDIFKLKIAEQLSTLSEYGDFSIPVARLRLQGNPVQLVKEFIEKFQTNEYITSTNSAVLPLNENYGINASRAGKVSIVEFSSPNIAKPFHAGQEANGHKTIGINYLDDWGKQYGLLAVGYKKYGNDEKLQKNPIKHLFHVYVSVNRDASENPFQLVIQNFELMGMPWAPQCHHINFGLVKSKDGQMSTRKGTVVFLEEILDAAKNEMHYVMKKNEAKYKQIEELEYVSDVVGMSAVMIQDMMARRVKDYKLDWNRMLSFEGDTGPYLQYAHARFCSLARNQSQYDIDENTDISCLNEKEAKDLINLISQYPALIKSLPAQLEPCMVVSCCMSCMRLAHAVSQALEALWVQDQEENVSKSRLALYTCARITLHNALSILGIRPLEKM
ncbi:hypothetical protein LY90DRAFT_677885 [Neocallimastix californiae]|uniref:arginine--tRNA ligase n=1 Tax=Neocallimastix californiae TaxID=1754190 RepID=A0A1Y1ZM85_9FUNG|nr:hypothetical protein LY90DRAFT_677885 [Neocallimastix californiae]|eukprot:ORY11369.1 hypothetical protein LY90DRAFT_677885 [Neocallimastix californiae]